MLIICPNCATSCDIDIASLRAAGRQVRCLRCQGVWHAGLPHAAKLLAAADALGPVRRTIEAVAQTVAEEAALAPEAGSKTAPAGGSPIESMTGEANGTIAEIHHERTPGEGRADPPCSEAGQSAFAPYADEHFGILQPIAPTDIAVAVPFEPFAAQRAAREAAKGIEAKSEQIAADGLKAEQGLAAQNDAAGDELVAGIAAIVVRRARQRSRRWRLPVSRLQLLILGLLLADAIIVGRRANLVQAMPQTASFYGRLGLPVNLRGVDFDSITAAAELHGGSSVLVVTGEVNNSTGKTEDVPELRFALRNAAQEEIYSWTVAPTRRILLAGEALTFRSQLPSPPLDTREFLVSFVDRANSPR